MASTSHCLSPLQTSLLAQARHHADGRLLLEASTGRPKPALSSALGALRRKGLLRRLGPNLWFLTEAAKALHPVEPGSARPTASRAPGREKLLVLLQQAEGVSIPEIARATGWQPHSVRAALSGLRRAGVGIDARRQADGSNRYRIASAGDGQ